MISVIVEDRYIIISMHLDHRQLQSRAAASDSCSGTRHPLSSGAEMHLIIYSSFRDGPRVVEVPQSAAMF